MSKFTIKEGESILEISKRVKTDKSVKTTFLPAGAAIKVIKIGNNIIFLPRTMQKPLSELDIPTIKGGTIRNSRQVGDEFHHNLDATADQNDILFE